MSRLVGVCFLPTLFGILVVIIILGIVVECVEVITSEH